jgi:hypothetical protein
VTGNHDGACLTRHDRHRGHCQLTQTIECRDLSLDAAAALDVNDGKPARVHHVTGNDDVRAPEEGEDIAVGVRRWLVQDLDRLIVQVQILSLVMKRFGR